MINQRLKIRSIELLSRKELREIHYSSIEVLEKAGILCESKDIIKVFKDAGADIKDKIIIIPESLINEALKRAPSSFKLCGRNPKYDIKIGEGKVYFGLGGTPLPQILDLESEKPRRSTKDDVIRATRLADALPNISYVMSICGAFDVPYEVEYLHEVEAILNNTVKPIVYPAPNRYLAKKIIELSAVVVNGLDELTKRPIVSLYSETSSPLIISEAVDNVFEFAKWSVPIFFGPSPLMGATGPMSIVGSIMLSNAESLAMLTLIQLINPNSPVVYATNAVTMDMRTTIALFGCPEWAICQVLNAQIARYYNLPCFGWGCATDSKLPDAQAGAEAALTALMAALAGVDTIHLCGYLASSSYGSLAMTVIADEIIGYINRIMDGVEFGKDALALNLILKLGPKSHFLTQKHTRDRYRKEVYLAKLFDRSTMSSWVKEGGKEIKEIAKERVKKILKEHKVEELPKDVKEKLSLIVKDAEKELVK
jgi:trimethylamine--corrinoid protein Co-methyltransferase